MERYCPYCMNILTSPGSCPSCGQDPAGYVPAGHHFPPGTLLHHRYLLGRVLGEGGFGITYLGRDVNLDRRVAVKEYFPTTFVKRQVSLTLDVTCYTESGRQCYEKGREKFLQEARTLAKLEDIPQIVRVLDYFQANNTAYIVMEFLEGETLKDLTARTGPLSPETLLPMMGPVLRAMAAMHREGIIHRDISPDNLMRMKDGSLKLMDFGCAKDMEGGHTMTVTLKYGFAPCEQYSGRGQGPWSDLYSLCATMYYCLTGKVPADAMERGEDAEEGREGTLPPPSRLGVSLDQRQEAALMKGMAVAPENRWQTAEDLFAALYGVTMDGRPWTWENGGQTEHVDREEPGEEETREEETREAGSASSKKRRPLPRAAKGAIAVACVLLAAAAGLALFSPKDPADITGQGGMVDVYDPQSNQETEEDGIDNESDILEDGSGLLPVISTELDGEQEDGEEAQDDQDGQADQEGQSGGQTTAPSGNTAAVRDPEPEPEPDPTPTKAELEAQAESARDRGQYAQAAAYYREMRDYGYLSGSKLGALLYELGLDAEYAWLDSQSSSDIKLAYELYTESANLGNISGMYCLGCLYAEGLHVSQSTPKAIEWWLKAAAVDGDYYYHPGLYYAKGWGIAQDTAKAAEYLQLCVAAQGFNSADAQALLDELQGG